MAVTGIFGITGTPVTALIVGPDIIIDATDVPTPVITGIAIEISATVDGIEISATMGGIVVTDEPVYQGLYYRG